MLLVGGGATFPLPITFLSAVVAVDPGPKVGLNDCKLEYGSNSNGLVDGRPPEVCGLRRSVVDVVGLLRTGSGGGSCRVGVLLSVVISLPEPELCPLLDDAAEERPRGGGRGGGGGTLT